MLHSLSRLHTEQMIEYKLVLLYIKIISHQAPVNLLYLLYLYIPSRQLRSSADTECSEWQPKESKWCRAGVLLKAKVKHSGVWSPNGWVTIMCCY